MENAFLLLVIVLLIITSLLLIALLAKNTHHRRKKTFTLPVTFFINSHKITGGITMVSLKYTQQLRGVIGSPVDAKGNETTVEPGSIKVTSSNEEIFTVEPDEDQPDNEAAFKIVAKKPGVAQLDFSADADLGEGTTTISGFTGVEVLPGEAVGFGQPIFGTPEEQPEAGEGEGGEGGGDNGNGDGTGSGNQPS